MGIEDYLYKGLQFYLRAPLIISRPLGYLYKSVPLSLRYGKQYSYYRNLIRQSEKWNAEEIQNFTNKNLKNTLINAYENSEYYKDLFSSVQFNPYNFSDSSEITVIPFSDKTVLRKNKQQILNRGIKASDLFYMTTGGTSGVPVEVYYIKGRERTREFVFMTDQWKRVGYRNGDRIARLRGTVVDHKGNNTYFRYEPIKNRLYLSTYDLCEENISHYIEQLRAFRPDFIHSYPSAIIMLASHMLRNDIVIPGIKAILCSSEQFFPGQRELIEKAFHCRVFSWYGHTEYSTLGGECECSSNYHLYFQYGYTELVQEDGKIVTEPGIKGEIVGTSFEMTAFPIIRYKTGDYAEWAEGTCSCGRNYKLMTNVEGRWIQEMIVTKKGSRISMTALNMHSDIFDKVIQYQFYQRQAGEVILRVIKSELFTRQDEEKILKSFQEKFKDLVDFNIQYVNNIPRTERGKHKFLLSELPSL